LMRTAAAEMSVQEEGATEGATIRLKERSMNGRP